VAQEDKERRQVLLRINSVLYNELNKWADDEFRSLNAQIEYVLTKALQKEHSKKANK